LMSDMCYGVFGGHIVKLNMSYRLLFWEPAAPWILPYTKASYCIEGGRSILVSKAGRRNDGGVGAEGCGGGIFWVFSMFPICSQRVPQDIPNSTSDFSHMVRPKFNSDVYKLKRWAIGE
jgi:hypothetical protein